jgi:opacity protein-like surface antigen
MRKSRKAFLFMAAAAAVTAQLIPPSVRAAEAGGKEPITSAAEPAATAEPATAESAIAEPAATAEADAGAQETLVSQSVDIVEEAVIYEQGTGFYATLGIGATWPNNVDGRVRRRNQPNRSVELETQAGFALDAGIGYDFGPVRAELTYVYNRIGVDDVKRNSNWQSTRTNGGNQNGIMASAYWDINTGSRWTPYVGGGIGWINQSMGNNSLVKVRNNGSLNRINTGSGNADLFGWQAKAGVAYGVNWNTDIYGEVVYQGAESFSTGRTSWDAFDNNWGFKIGARYRFGGPVVIVEEEEVVITPEPAPAPVYREPAPVYREPAPAPAPIRGLW